MEDIRLFKYILKFLKPYIFILLLSFLMLLITTFSDMISPIILKNAIDRGIVPFVKKGDFKVLYVYSIFYLILILVSALSTYFFILLITYAGNLSLIHI